MWYPYLRKLLFRFDAEKVHDFALKTIEAAYRLGLTKHISQVQSPRQLMGLTFPNAVGLAAGFDRNGEHIEALAALGFGFIEVGSATPQLQVGKPKPRIFRVTDHQGIINRMGFYNDGVDYLVEQLKRTKYRGILGVNIGKNPETPLDNAIDDYIYCFRRVAPYASYVTINISSPNTVQLRDLQTGDYFRNLLRALIKERDLYSDLQKNYVPLVVKVAPDLTDEDIVSMADVIRTERADAVIATNTSVQRDVIKGSSYENEPGGLSGKPLTAISTEIIKKFYAELKDEVPIIGCGGVMSVQDAKDKIAAGAKLIQLYSGLIYAGPGLIRATAKVL